MPDSSLAKPDSQKWIIGRARFRTGDADQLFVINGVTQGPYVRPDIMFKSTNS
jgi:hypothetical protein